MTSEKVATATKEALLLKVLLKQRHLHVYSAFSREYDKVAAKLDRELIGTVPSKAQFYRWLSGELARLPYSHHCRVLESMFPDWGVEQLFQPYSGSLDLFPNLVLRSPRGRWPRSRQLNLPAPRTLSPSTPPARSSCTSCRRTSCSTGPSASA